MSEQTNGRIESYVHSDSITRHKGGALIKVACDSEAGSRTDDFAAFALKAAKMAYAADTESWAGVILVFPHMEEERLALCQKLKEEVVITKIAVFTL